MPLNKNCDCSIFELVRTITLPEPHWSTSAFRYVTTKVWCRAQCTRSSILWHWSRCTLWTWLHHFWQAMPNSSEINGHKQPAPPICNPYIWNYQPEANTHLKNLRSVWGFTSNCKRWAHKVSSEHVHMVSTLFSTFSACVHALFFTLSLIVPCANNCSPKLKDIAAM